MAETVATPGATDELPQTLFILPWQHRGKAPLMSKRWLDEPPPGQVKTVDEHELRRKVKYHAILGRSAPIGADKRDKIAQEE